MKILGIIPARFESSRFPGKPLVDINGKAMIQRVYEQASKCASLSSVVVATDDERIYDHVISFGGKAIMTSVSHRNGTERCAEVVSSFDQEYDAIINIQGDEPFINPEQIAQVCACFEHQNVQIATLKKPIVALEELTNPNRPKVHAGSDDFAIMFSRKPIPTTAKEELENKLKQGAFFKHIGIYGYRPKTLQELVKLNPSPLEIEERLEQLRWLENGYQIKVALTQYEAQAIDTPEDLEKIISK